MPKVSVIMPVYNGAAFIGETLRSVLAQTRQDFDIHVVDDGSTDTTSHVVRALGDSRIITHTRPHTGLPAAGRNFGIANSAGTYVTFLDSDDLWLPNKLAVQVAAAEAHPEAGLFYARAQRFRDMPDRRLGWIEGREPVGSAFQQLLFLNFIPTSSVLIPRSVLETVGVFDETPAFRAAEDYDLWLRIAHQYPLLFIPETLSLYRQHGENISQLQDSYYQRWTAILEKTLRSFPVRPDLQHRARANVQYEHFRYLVMRGQDAEALRALEKGLAECPNHLKMRVMRWILICRLQPVLRAGIACRRALKGV